MIIDGLNYRFAGRNEQMPEFHFGKESSYDYVRRNGGGDVVISGKIGYSGGKTHRFNASYIILNGERVITSFYSVCGSQSYKSGAAALTEVAEVTCKKCRGGK